MKFFRDFKKNPISNLGTAFAFVFVGSVIFLFGVIIVFGDISGIFSYILFYLIPFSGFFAFIFLTLTWLLQIRKKRKKQKVRRIRKHRQGPDLSGLDKS